LVAPVAARRAGSTTLRVALSKKQKLSDQTFDLHRVTVNLMEDLGGDLGHSGSRVRIGLLKGPH
jgi:hypothetical protein